MEEEPPRWSLRFMLRLRLRHGVRAVVRLPRENAHALRPERQSRMGLCSASA